MHVKWQKIKVTDHYKHDKSEKFENDTVGWGPQNDIVGWGPPPPCKKGCYTLVAIEKVGFHSRVLELAS